MNQPDTGNDCTKPLRLCNCPVSGRALCRAQNLKCQKVNRCTTKKMDQYIGQLEVNGIKPGNVIIQCKSQHAQRSPQRTARTGEGCIDQVLPAERRNPQRLVVKNIGGIIELKITPEPGQISECGQQCNDTNKGSVSEPVRFFQEIIRYQVLSEGSYRRR